MQQQTRRGFIGLIAAICAVPILKNTWTFLPSPSKKFKVIPTIGTSVKTANGIDISISWDGWMWAGQREGLELFTVQKITLDGKDIPINDCFGINLETKQVAMFERDPVTKELVRGIDRHPVKYFLVGNSLDVIIKECCHVV